MFTSFKTVAKLTDTVIETIRYAEKDIEKWQGEFSKSPDYALSWGMGVFSAAAKLKVAREVKAAVEFGLERCIDSDKILDSVRRMALEAVSRSARYPARSTSPTSNLMEQEMASAWAEILSGFDYLNKGD